LAAAGGIERTLSIHTHSSVEEKDIRKLGAASITSDPRPGHEYEDYGLAYAIANTAERGGTRLPGNFRGTFLSESYSYPTTTARKPDDKGGVSFGQYGSHAAGTRGAMNQILVEILGAGEAKTADSVRGKEISAVVDAIQEKFLADPQKVASEQKEFWNVALRNMERAVFSALGR
jgi:hypothetical protein